MWNWLAENPKKRKKDWPGWKNHNDYIFPKAEHSYCFLCGYVSADPEKGCSNCLLDWIITGKCISTEDESESYFGLYYNAKTEKEQSKYAKIIAELPEKKDNTMQW